MDEKQKGVAPRRCAQDGCGVPSDLVLVDPEGLHPDACFSHAPWLDDARELARRKGGLKLMGRLRRNTFLTVDDLGALESPSDAQRWAAVIAQATATGRLSSSAASVALKAVEAWIAAHEAVDLEARLAELESRVAERDAAERAQRQTRPSQTYMGRETT